MAEFKPDSKKKSQTAASITVSKSVCDQIIEYYFKFGQDRDLEKFLRLRKSYSNLKSSSEGSIETIENRKTFQKSYTDIQKNVSCPEINTLSGIELAIPKETCQNHCFHKSVCFNDMDKEQNKTQSNISINITSTGCLKDVEAQCSKDKLLRTPKNFPRAPKSPDSALKSQKKLEWDSLGDIGYRSNSNSDSISTLERSVLKDFFAKRGIKVNFSSKQKNLGKLFASLKNVSEVSKSKEDSEEKTEDFKSGKLVNIPHSTPKTPLIENPETQESSEALPIEINTFQDGIQELKYDSSQKSSPENSNVSEKIEDQNKYCQTSKILTNDQYVQADCSNNNSKSNTCSFPSTTFTSENTASSFEYLDPNTENKENVKSVKIKTEVELGVKLLCSLIESNNLSSNQKTKLARSIVKRLTKSNNIENIMMNCSDSMSDTSLQNVKSFLSKLNPKSKDFERNFMENGTQTSPNNKISQSHNESNYISRNPISKINEKTETKCTQTSSELTDRFEKRLNDIEAEIKKISLYKQKLIASNDSQRLIAGQENPSSIIEESRTVLQRETEKYEDKAYNPLNMYRRSTNKSVYTTTIYKNNKSNKISKTKIEINEEQPMFAKDIRLRMKTPSDNSTFESSSSFEANRSQLKSSSRNDGKSENNHYSEPTTFNDKLLNHNLYEAVSSLDSYKVTSYNSTLSSVSKSPEKLVTLGVQTNDSLKNTIPFYGTKAGSQRTYRTYEPNHNQQVQAKPSSLAYVINFKVDQGYSTNSSSCRSQDSLTLQDILKNEKPQFFQKANQRKEILNEIKNLRNARNEKIRKIVANESDLDKIEQQLRNLPPEPMKQIRVFTSKTLRKNTRKKYAQLPEVLERQYRTKQDKLLKDNMKIKNIFNKRMRDRVRKGKLTLELSRTVI